MDLFSVESDLRYSLTKWFTVGAGLRGADDGRGWEFSSTSPYLQFNLTEPDAPFHLLFLAGVEISADGEDDNNVHRTTSSRTETFTSERTRRITTLECLETGGKSRDDGIYDYCQPVTRTVKETIVNSRTVQTISDDSDVAGRRRGVHQRGDDAVFTRFIAEREFGKDDRVLLNIIHITPADGSTVFGYGVGWRHQFEGALAGSLEAVGSFSEGGHMILGGLYYAPSESILLKAGVGLGLDKNAPDFTLRAGVIWVF